MSGDRETRTRAALFEGILQDETLRLTAMTQRDWGNDRAKVDRALFALADGEAIDDVAKELGVTAGDVRNWVELSGDAELRARV